MGGTKIARWDFTDPLAIQNWLNYLDRLRTENNMVLAHIAYMDWKHYRRLAGKISYWTWEEDDL